MTETTRAQNYVDANPVAGSRTLTVSLAAIGCPVPETATCEVTIVARSPGSREIILERNHTWSVESVSGAGVLTAVYDDGDDPMDRPTRVPEWIRAVCELVGVDEVRL